VLGVSFDPTAAILASASGSTITFTTVDTGEPNGAPLRLEHDVNGVEISRDGRMVVVSSRDRVTVWDMAARKLVHTLEGVDFPVIGATFSPDSQYILANGEKVAQFWETATGKALGARMRWVDHSSPTWGTHRAIFRSDGRVAVTGGFPIRMWAVPTGEPLGAASLAAETYYPAFTPDGRRLMVQGRLFDLAPGLLPASQLPQTPLVGSLIVSPDSKTLAVLEHDGSQPWNRLLNLRAGNSIGEPAKISFSRGRLPLPLFSPDGGTVALLLGTNKLELRDASTGQPKSPTLSMDGVVRAAAFSSDGKMIATGDLGGVVRLWNAQSGEQIGKPMIHRYPIWRLQFSADVRMLLAAGGELGGIHGEARLWDTTTTEPLGPSLNIMGSVHDAAISPNGQSIAVAAFQLSVFDTATSQLRWRGTRYDIMQIAFSPDSQTVLARSWTLPVAGMYDVETGALIANMKHQTAIGKSELSPDGQLVLTSGDDLVARLWDASTGLPVGPPWKTRQRPPIGTFEVDGQSILLADDQNISRWRLATTIEGSREQIRLSVEVATRLRLDETNEVQPLASTRSPEMSQDNKPVPTDDPYPHAWKRLQELGGPVGYFRR
jgi:WD40 repeat protein